MSNRQKLWTGDAEAYIEWHKQLDQVITGKPCDTNKARFEIVEMMLYGDLSDKWLEISDTIRKANVTRKEPARTESRLIKPLQGAIRTLPSEWLRINLKNSSSRSSQPVRRRNI